MNPETAWKIAGLVIAALASVTGILAALYGIVTVPVLRTLKAEISASESRIKIEIIASETRLEKQIIASETKLEKQMVELEKRMVEMEHNLNQRIDTRFSALAHH